MHTVCKRTRESVEDHSFVVFVAIYCFAFFFCCTSQQLLIHILEGHVHEDDCDTYINSNVLAHKTFL